MGSAIIVVEHLSNSVRNFAADFLNLNDITIPWSLPSPLLYHYNSLVVKIIKRFPQFKQFFTIYYYIGLPFL